MFGYIRPRVDALRVWEEAYYRAAYCGLCRCLGRRYGMTSRFLVNYDSTFLYLLLAGHEELPPCGKCFCPARPLCRKACVPITPAMEYAADVCVILCAGKLDDARRDGHGIKRLPPAVASLLLRRAVRKAGKRRPGLTELLKKQLTLLHQLEDERCASMDRAADAFAGFLCHCADEALPEEKRPAQQLLYHVGRFIYLTDALDDLPKDAKSGNYNPLLCRFPCPAGALSAEDRAYVRESIEASVAMAGSALALCALKSHRGLLENIVSLGLPAVLCAVDQGTFQAKRKMKAKGAL